MVWGEWSEVCLPPAHHLHVSSSARVASCASVSCVCTWGDGVIMFSPAAVVVPSEVDAEQFLTRARALTVDSPQSRELVGDAEGTANSAAGA